MTREPRVAHLLADNERLRAEVERLRIGIDRIVGLCLSDAGIGKIHARAVALLADEEPKP